MFLGHASKGDRKGRRESESRVREREERREQREREGEREEERQSDAVGETEREREMESQHTLPNFHKPSYREPSRNQHVPFPLIISVVIRMRELERCERREGLR